MKPTVSLTSTRVADERDGGQALAFLTPCALRLAFGIHGDDFQLQFGNPVTNLAFVEFGVRFASPPAAHAAALPTLRARQFGGFTQAWCHVAETGNFHLRLGRP